MSEEILPVEDLMTLVEARLTDQLGELELAQSLGDEEKLSPEQVEAQIADKLQEEENKTESKLLELEDKLKTEAVDKFNQVESVLSQTGQALTQLEKAGKDKFSEVESQVGSKVEQALTVGMTKIAEAESKMAEAANAEINKAKEDGKAFLVLQFAEFEKKIESLIDSKIAEALGGKE